ncbi:UDP-N-acetylmuramoylalanyl-D-glutamate--2,6-diaminopimelate ligase [Ferrimonas sediminum]|uniref:UDP-N-acetylmuramoylalanyl-D-glutamate--2,6-diaminopimelate ligase n=1 Tax=Ferrimonas sediminum TaxID=718193 RepID=A0A1G8RZL9_9GAMM|nr:UDP-N-acetylmuramoyl-L-alanyl-D-glutamate--2,6-diaminopimelate ligase [Ferrimonas sediminum]SDJ22418.1 UDP-N-acetylmuramoylalanyl-D-glutamate--2,6-diaminopimelate ligase [Ferrimonas sediminum]
MLKSTLLDTLNRLGPARFVLDSRAVRSGDAFVCKQGLNQDSHQFAEAAVDAGACVVIATRPLALSVPCLVTGSFAASISLINHYLQFPAEGLTQIGVTGTNGKTTVAYGLHQLLNQEDHSSYSGTLGRLAGNHLVPQLNTTADAVTLLNQFHELRQQGYRHHVMEVSSHALAQDRVDAMLFDVAVFTNISEDHLDFHGHRDAYQQAKLRLIDRLKPGGTAVINLDDDSAAVIADRCRQRADIIGYSCTDSSATLYADIHHCGAQGSEFVLHYQQNRYPCRLALPFQYNVENALAMIGAALAAGHPLSTVIHQLVQLRTAPGRGQRMVWADGSQAIVDYAHNQPSLSLLLNQARQQCQGAIHTVVGVTGDRIEDAAQIGTTALTLSDHCYFTCDNPLGRPIEQILKRMDPDRAARQIPCRHGAIAAALAAMKPGDLLLLCGKGDEQYQYLSADRAHPAPYDGDWQILTQLRPASR